MITIYNSWKIKLHSLSIETDYDISLLIVNGMELSITNSSFSSNSITIAMCYTPHTHYTINEPVNVSLANCDIQGGANTGLYLATHHSESYLLDVSVRRINVHHGNINILLYLSNSRYSFNFDKITSFGGRVGLKLEGHHIDSYSVNYLPSSVVLITDSEIYNNSIGIKYRSFTTTVSHTCSIKNKRHNNAVGVPDGDYVIRRVNSSENINVHIKDTIISHSIQNIIKNYDRLTFTNVSIYGTTSTGLTLNNSVLHVEGSLTIFNNTGTNGGGIELYEGSLLVLAPNTKLHIYNNTADRGGGLFTECFYCPMIQAQGGSKQPNILVNISDNTAVIGNDIYVFDARKCDNKVHFNSDI
jgi:hypothetical protein